MAWGRVTGVTGPWTSPPIFFKTDELLLFHQRLESQASDTTPGWLFVSLFRTCITKSQIIYLYNPYLWIIHIHTYIFGIL